ncbi:MAG TPA: AAA family ATPase [Pirellulales bacterium]|jgi:type II secretory pathway predicted ATPase ExeA|nr:AAA family ATPase [Pirellulales bacterium]
MHYEHWGLREAPFDSHQQPRWFYSNPVHDEALARLHYLLDSRRRLGLLLGESGCGKSMVLRMLAHQLRSTTAQVAVIGLWAVEPEEMLEQLALAWGLDPAPGESCSRIWRRLNDRLAEHRLQRLASVILFDDADRAPPATHTQIERLAQCDTFAGGGLTIVLSAQRDYAHRISHRLLELGDLRIDLGPWSLADTQGYVAHVLRQAGRSRPAFDAQAIERLHELAGGVPRQINQLGELSLVAGAGQQLNLVDMHTVETVSDELRVPDGV